MPGQSDLKDEKLFEAVTSFLQKRGAPAHSDYDFARVDLNHDGKRDGIVLFKLPHTYWCGWDGCGMLVLNAGAKEFTPISLIGNVRGPIYVSNQSQNGWRDIIIRISGARMRDKNIVLHFNGSGYPQSPLLAPDLNIPMSGLETEMFFR